MQILTSPRTRQEAELAPGKPISIGVSRLERPKHLYGNPKVDAPEGMTMTQPATASFMRDASTPDALTRARRRLLTTSPRDTDQHVLTDEELRDLADPDWTPPHIDRLDAQSTKRAAPTLRALLAEAVTDALGRLLALERPHGSYDDTPDGHEAFTRRVTADYDRGNRHLARATIRHAHPEQAMRAGLECLGLPADSLPIIGELADASNPADPITRTLTDAALLDLDRHATGRGILYSRVASTLILAAPSEERLDEAIDAVAGAAVALGVPICDLATQHVDADATLASIGIDHAPPPEKNQPSDLADRILYVGRDGARVHVKAGRLLVDGPAGIPATSLPKNNVARIVLSGNVGLSAGARSWAMRSGIDVVCLSRRGSYQGALVGAGRGTHAARLLAQSDLTRDEERRVGLAAALIGSKIRGQIHVLTRIARRDPSLHLADTTAHMHHWRRNLADARTINDIMGIEGACSTAYFDALAACVPADVPFDGRSRRPPRDLPNAALSYGYAILLGECVGALHAAGLDPSLGIAHAPTDKRPSLALDLMEEFRPLLVDQTVLALLRTRKLRPEHSAIEPESGGVWLGAEGKKILVDAYEAASQRSVTGALPGYSGSWRRHITHEAQLLARAITEPDYQWKGIAWR